jgi:hypothetical protein
MAISGDQLEIYIVMDFLEKPASLLHILRLTNAFMDTCNIY